MSRLTFPNAEDRLVYTIESASDFRPKVGAKVRIYSDLAGTILADIRTLAGGLIANSELTVDGNSLLPQFLGPNDSSDTLYAKGIGGTTVTEIHADVDSRIDVLNSQLAALDLPLAPVFNVVAFGATGDGVTNDKVAIQTAIDAALVSGGIVFFPTGVYRINTGLTINARLISLQGTGRTQIIVPDTFAGDAITVYSDASYTTTIENVKPVLKGIILKSLAGEGLHCPGNGLVIGHVTEESVSNFSLQDGAVQGFTNNIKFIQNAWRIQFINFNSRWGNIVAAATLTNFGENMSFTNCMFADASEMNIDSGLWKFLHCSFDNCPITFNDEVFCTFESCHFEEPGGTGNYRYLSLTHSAAMATLDNCNIVVNSAKTKSLFYSISTNAARGRGIIFNGCSFPNRGDFVPETDDTDHAWVSGGGRAIAKNSQFSFGSFFDAVISYFANLCHNGNAELNDTSGWTTAGGGGGGGLSAQNTKKRSGSYGFKLSADQGTTATTYYDVPVTPGEIFLACLWRATQLNDAACTTAVRVQFLSADGTVLATSGYAPLNATQAAFALVQGFGTTVPTGAVKARFLAEIFGGLGGGTSHLYFDDLCMNVA